MKHFMKRFSVYALYLSPTLVYADNLTDGLDGLITYLSGSIAGFFAVLGLICAGYFYYAGRSMEGHQYLKNTILGTFIILAGSELVKKAYSWVGTTWTN